MLISLIMVSWFFKNLYCIVRNIFFEMKVADLIGADPKEIVFTSGATESNNISVKGVARYAWPVPENKKCYIISITECTSDNYAKLFGIVRSLEHD